MKEVKMRSSVVVLLIGLICAGLWLALPRELIADQEETEAKVPYPWQRILVAGYGLGKIEIMNRSGAIEWTHKDRVQVCDVWMLDEGRIVYSARKQGVKMIQPDLETGRGGKLVWHYEIPEGAETHSCQPLGDGTFLIGISQGGVSYVLEVDTEGKEYARVKVTGRGNAHKTFRVIRKTSRGTYLINAQGEGYKGRRAIEIDAEGKVLRSFPGGGFLAVPLPNGNVLLSSGDERVGAGEYRIQEIDPEGKVVWQIGREELEGIKIGYAAGVQRLPNGNTLICNWNGHNNAEGPAFFEVTPEKKVVWKAPADYQTRVTSVMILDEAYRKNPQR
jgi:hypothetical protein